MSKLGRRGFLKLSSGALAGSMGLSLRRALAVPANNATRSIREHDLHLKKNT